MVPNKKRKNVTCDLCGSLVAKSYLAAHKKNRQVHDENIGKHSRSSSSSSFSSGNSGNRKLIKKLMNVYRNMNEGCADYDAVDRNEMHLPLPNQSLQTSQSFVLKFGCCALSAGGL
uniref:Uncharacterized protein n=1 Tax=Octactis speculum TaxID=3111310 RepID=A0A7S2CX05_9STRA|mmetsp:Transcript_40864/g.55651  ORF Transcript_40864/g.55651 Transcript_40864/m.55651 type:complete len:116 (+) Transcript_40864:153-500(+)